MAQPLRHVVLVGFWSILTLVSAQITTNYIEGFLARVTNPPAGARCGVKGSLKAANVLRDFIAGPNARDSCRNSCFSAELAGSCNSYAFHSDNNRCRLFRTTLAEQKYVATPAAANVEFWSKECWQTNGYATSETWLTTDSLSNAYDDAQYAIILPFFVTFCNSTSNTVYMSVNGILSWQPPSSSFSNTALPATGPNSQYLPPTSIVCGWDDLIVSPSPYYPSHNHVGGNRAQWLSYKIRGVGPQRTVSFHWRVAYTAPDGTKSFLDSNIELYENRPGDALMVVNDIGNDFGSGMTFGSQCLQSNNKADQIGYNIPVFSPGDLWTYNKGQGYWRNAPL